MRRDPDPIRTAILAQAGRAVFDHPRDLLEAAQDLASREPRPDRLMCHLDDYRASGLSRNGPVTYLVVLPTQIGSSRMFETALANEIAYHKVALEPDFYGLCPLGEVRVYHEGT